MEVLLFKFYENNLGKVQNSWLPHLNRQQMRALAYIRTLCWLYFWLLIFEGAIRKWAFPFLATPLLLIRDPIVLIIYYLALHHGIFPRVNFIKFGSALAAFTLVSGLCILQDAIPVALFGFRCYFLHLPLIWVLPLCFTTNDLKKIGYWTLMLAVPLAIIMAIQHASAPGAFINAGAGEEAKQIALDSNHVRASATFSFVTGAVSYFSMASAFLINGYFTRGQYPRWLLWSASVALGMALVFAGSRTMLVSVGIVLAFALFAGLILQPKLTIRTLKLLTAFVVAGVILLQIDIFRGGLEALSNRIETANRTEGKGNVTGVLDERVWRDFTRPLEAIYEAPLFGHGLGLGTVVGSYLSSGRKYSADLGRDSERELARIIFENGPILGLGIILLRWNIAFSILWKSVLCAMKGETLPFLLSSISSLIFINGNMGQTTTIGFGVFIAGLCLAGIRDHENTLSYSLGKGEGNSVLPTIRPT